MRCVCAAPWMEPSDLSWGVMAEPVLRVEPLLKRWVWAAGMLGLGFVCGIVACFVSSGC